jgi:hypothetical protein
MTHPHPALPTYYRVDLSPEAWKEVGCVPAVDFAVLQDVIALLAVEGTPYEQGLGPYALTVAGLEVLYTRDDVTRTLTLHRVARALQQPGEPQTA